MGLTQNYSSPSCKARVEMSSEMDPKYIYAQEHKLYYFFITLHGIEKIETEKKNDENTLKNISFINTVRYGNKHCSGSKTFDWLHFSPPNSPFLLQNAPDKVIIIEVWKSYMVTL